MTMVGKIAIKNSGREAGYKCVIIEQIDLKFVFISSGGTNKIRRRQVNLKHLQLTDKQIEIAPNASESEVKSALEEAKLVSGFKKQIDS